MAIWQIDPWLLKSEQFYQSIYKDGKCKFCGMEINTPLTVCDCSQMKQARSEYRAKIRAEAGLAPITEPRKSVVDDPNQRTEAKEPPYREEAISEEPTF